ncbi:unnamed protein product, partial [Discosporangium mesarthrocarpum]
FDHSSDALPELRRRFQKNASGRGSKTRPAAAAARPHGCPHRPFSTEHGLAEDKHDALLALAAAGAAGEGEGAATQLNGGSDPVLITVSHRLGPSHGAPATAQCGSSCPETAEEHRGGTSAPAAGAGGVGAGGCGWGGGEAGAGEWGCGLTLQVNLYNATNARLHGFVVQLGFGRGAEVLGLGKGGRVEASVEEVLMPSAAHTVEVPLGGVLELQDVVVHVSVSFLDAE